jgi:hypothetical protein
MESGVREGLTFIISAAQQAPKSARSPFALNLAQGGAPDMGTAAGRPDRIDRPRAARLRRSGGLPRLSEGRFRIDAAAAQIEPINVECDVDVLRMPIAALEAEKIEYILGVRERTSREGHGMGCSQPNVGSRLHRDQCWPIMPIDRDRLFEQA